MAEEYRADTTESRTTTSSQLNGAGDSLVISKPCPVLLPRELTDLEKTLWTRYQLTLDEDYYGYGVGLIDAWKDHLSPTLDVLEHISEYAGYPETEGQLKAVVHSLRRSVDDFRVIVALAHDLIPYDKKLLRRI